MTAVAVDRDPPRVRSARARDFAELLLVGGATPLLFPVAWLARAWLGLDAAELAIGFLTFHAAFVVNDPHFAVTYLLFYRERARTWRWIVAGVAVPGALGAWAIAALATKSAASLGLMMELMFFLVGWHYVKQGFGVMIVLAARRGVRFDARERLALLAHAIAGWAYAWASPAKTATEVEEKGVVFFTIARPAWLERATLVVLLASAALLAVVLVRKRMREGRISIATPLVAFLASIWAWSIYSSIDPLVVYVVPALHSLQYLYFVGLAKRNEAREREGPPWFEVAAPVRVGALAASAIALGVVLFHAAPSLLDAALVPRRLPSSDEALGPTPYFAAIYAFVNIHHYVMDSVIWRRGSETSRHLVATAR